jgi:TM2 domain-containing membrane protein YozV
MKIQVLLILFFLTNTIKVIYAQDPDNTQNIPSKQYEWLYLEPNNVQETDTAQNINNYCYKKPGLAFGLSLLCPGLGQFYNGEVVKGIAMSVLSPTSALLCFALTTVLDSHLHLAPFFVGIFYANYIWSLIDAPVSANKINRRNHALSLNLGNNRILSITPNVLASNSIGTKTRYHSPAYGLSLKLDF